MPLLRKKAVFAAAIETTAGTAESLDAGDGVFNAYNFDIQLGQTVEEREGQGAFNRLQGVPGAAMGTATMTTDLGWDGTTTMPSWAAILLPALGFVETSQVFNPVTAAPGTGGVKTLTIGKYTDGKRRQIHGAMGTAQMILPSARMARMECNFTGCWNAETDTAIIAPTYPTAFPLKFSSATITFNSVAVKVESVTIDFGNVVILREDPSTASGYSTALVTDRNPRITLNPEANLVATLSTSGLLSAGTQAAFQVVLDGPTDSTLTIDAPKCQVMTSQEGDRNGMLIEDIELACQKNATTSDKELFFTFSEAS